MNLDLGIRWPDSYVVSTVLDRPGFCCQADQPKNSGGGGENCTPDDLLCRQTPYCLGYAAFEPRAEQGNLRRACERGRSAYHLRPSSLEASLHYPRHPSIESCLHPLVSLVIFIVEAKNFPIGWVIPPETCQLFVQLGGVHQFIWN